MYGLTSNFVIAMESMGCVNDGPGVIVDLALFPLSLSHFCIETYTNNYTTNMQSKNFSGDHFSYNNIIVGVIPVGTKDVLCQASHMLSGHRDAFLFEWCKALHVLRGVLSRLPSLEGEVYSL